VLRIGAEVGERGEMATREMTPTDYLSMFRRRWVLIVSLAVVGPLLAYVVSVFLPTRYKSQTLVLVDEPSVSTGIIGDRGDASDLSQKLASMQQQILSRSRLEPIIHKYNLFPKDINRASMDALVIKLQKDIEVSPIMPLAETHAKDLPGFNITVTLDNPHTAQDVCADITNMFIEQSLQSTFTNAQNTTRFLENQLQEAKTSLDAQDAKLAEFKSKHFQELPEDEQTNLNLLTGLNSQLDAATQALGRAQQDKSFSESMLSQQLSAWQATQSGANPETLDRQLAALQTQLATLQVRYTDDYPDVIKTKSDIAALQQKMNDANSGVKDSSVTKSPRSSIEPPQVQQLRASIHTLDLAIAEKSKEQERIQQEIRLYQSRIQSSPGVEQQYKEIMRGYQTALESYNDLQKRRDQSAMATDLVRKQEGEQLRVLDPANLPDKPSFPNRPLFALGGLGGGLGLGMALAFLLEMKDTSFKTERDVEFALQLPVLAMVPSIDPQGDKRSRQRPPAAKSLEVGARA
jgi:polysaccharide chain length determinant protein (PEP-CTERM system associated)